MYCQNCGQELPAGAMQCAACGAHVPGHPHGWTSMSVNQLKEETRRAAHELAETSERLAQRLASHAESAAKDPSEAARKVARRVAKELDDLGKDIEQVLKEL